MDQKTLPLGIRVLPSLKSCNRNVTHRVFILVFTFLCYTSYHLSRKPISVVKSVLHRNCSVPLTGSTGTKPANTSCDWPPFDKSNYEELLGSLDLSYLFAYAVGMFVSGHVAERMNLRYFLSLGMISSGIMTAMFGMGYFWNVHKLSFYIGVQVIAGFFQSSGWPSVVACVGNWYGKGRRGLIMGIWNSHTSVGNILGSLIAAIWVNHAWGWSFVVPGIIIGSFGVLVFFFLVPDPADIGCSRSDDGNKQENETNYDSLNNARAHKPGHTNQGFDDDCSKVHFWFDHPHEPKITLMAVMKQPPRNKVKIIPQPLLTPYHSYGSSQGTSTDSVKKEEAISILKAIKIPGVIEFAMCLFFAKLVSYTFLFWLPNYINTKAHYNPEEAADLSTLFDVGGVVGGIIAGLISDATGARASTCAIMLIFAAPMLYVYNLYGSLHFGLSIGLLLICGLLVNGPYALITTAVSADLGTHKSLQGNSKALATVTAIIDGTGSIGAAIGPLLTGIISPTGWDNVFWMLIASDLIACLLLLRLVFKDIRSCVHRHPVLA